ncbi:hypothetical protein PAHAL_3G155400 [Panicum hallii]|uniref:Uncharacterized protein n=1 Tax=Panicum hallii TaxID=206008 RepID=A0A2T8KIA3_9POAL|nr:hypothetical protein PAHAL_3G155400 [Panicum hallii]
MFRCGPRLAANGFARPRDHSGLLAKARSNRLWLAGERETKPWAARNCNPNFQFGGPFLPDQRHAAADLVPDADASAAKCQPYPRCPRGARLSSSCSYPQFTKPQPKKKSSWEEAAVHLQSAAKAKTLPPQFTPNLFPCFVHLTLIPKGDKLSGGITDPSSTSYVKYPTEIVRFDENHGMCPSPLDTGLHGLYMQERDRPATIRTFQGKALCLLTSLCSSVVFLASSPTVRPRKVKTSTSNAAFSLSWNLGVYCYARTSVQFN